jgi:ketosteroid isomerase-like protein
MRKILSNSLLLTFIFLIGCKNNKEQTVETPLDAKKLMNASSERFKKFWDLGDSNSISGEFTEDAIRVISNPASPIEGNEKIKNTFIATFSEGSELKNSQINIAVLETRFVSEDILLGTGTFEISDANNAVLERGKWGNVYKFSDGKIKMLLESAHRNIDPTKVVATAPFLLEKSIISEALHFEKIEASVSHYIKFANEGNAEKLSQLFAENGIQNVSSKEGVVMGREKIKSTEKYAEGQVLNANVLGYKYLGNSLAIGYGNWTQLDEKSNTMVTGQWGNLFKIEGDVAYLLMESAGLY